MLSHGDNLMPKPMNLLTLKADFYDKRRVGQDNTCLSVTLPIERCRRYQIEKGTIMRIIATKDVFVILPEQTYQQDPLIRLQIENFLEKIKPEVTL